MVSWTHLLHTLNRVLEAAPLMPLAVVWFMRRKISSKFRLVVYYVQAEFLFFILDIISRRVFHNNVYLFHISTFSAVLLIIGMYYKIFVSSKIKWYIIISIGIFVIVAFADAAFINNMFVDVNSYAQSLGSAILSALSIMHIAKLSRSSASLENQPEFFFSISILLYFSYTIVTYTAINVVYNSDYDRITEIRLDRIISAPDAILYAIHMGLLAWMFTFFPLSINPLRALPRWLHYSRWYPRPYKLLGQHTAALHRLTAPEN